MFSHLIGNEEVKSRLSRMLANGRLPNAMLFSGPDGVGKKLFALEIARSFVCTASVENVACGKCAACKRVSNFNTPTSDKGEDYDNVFFSEHADVGLVIPFKRNLRVGAIRALDTQANFRPYEAFARVFIVDHAEKMNDAAANALLKTLEEPPETTYIILITARPDALLSTIRSRCQTIRFVPVGLRETEEFLIRENSISSDEAKISARFANGSVSRATSFEVDRFRVQRESQLKIIEQGFVKADRPSLIRSSEQMNDAKNKDLFEENIEILGSLVHDIWLLQNRTDDPQMIKNGDITDRLQHFAAAVSPKKLADCLVEIELLRQSLAVNINRKTATEALFMKMAA